MRDMGVIKKNRDGLRDAALAIGVEMTKLRDKHGQIGEMPTQVRLHYSRLATLRAHYLTQVNALSFTLNQDSILNTMQGAPMFEGYEEFMYKQED